MKFVRPAACSLSEFEYYQEVRCKPCATANAERCRQRECCKCVTLCEGVCKVICMESTQLENHERARSIQFPFKTGFYRQLEEYSSAFSNVFPVTSHTSFTFVCNTHLPLTMHCRHYGLTTRSKKVVLTQTKCQHLSFLQEQIHVRKWL